MNCGSYTKDRVGALARPCPNNATTAHFIRAKARLLEGRHPVTDAWLSRPYPVCKIVFQVFPEAAEEYDELEIVDLPQSVDPDAPLFAAHSRPVTDT